MDTTSLDAPEVVESGTEPDAAMPSEASKITEALGQELGWDILSSLYPEDDFDD